MGSALAQDKLPLIKVVATGGTIANTPSGRLHAGEVAEAIPALKKVARLDVEEVIRVGSSAITVENWLTLARRINEILAREPEVKGIVVTHGSNTVEETAYFLSLTIKTDKPNIKVSWQVTGIRHDAYADAHRIPVEENKPANEQGYYLHPEFYGQPDSKAMEYSKPGMQTTQVSVTTGK